MVFLISRLDEVRAAKSIFRMCREELAKEGVPMADQVPFGIMIEARGRFDRTSAGSGSGLFLSAQMTWFSTRLLSIVETHTWHRPMPLHPAMLTLISGIADAGQAHGIDVSMCGEMGGDPLCLPVMGLGIQNLSMNATSIPPIKAMIRSLSISGV